jgi:hypothetical protein
MSANHHLWLGTALIAFGLGFDSVVIVAFGAFVMLSRIERTGR